jgi:hypothetical protein
VGYRLLIKVSRRNSAEKLVKEPIEKMTPMTLTNMTNSITNGGMGLAQALQPVTFSIKEEVSNHNQRPEALDSQGVHQLVVVEAEEFFGVGKENLNIPTGSDMSQQGGGIGLEVAGSPKAGGAVQLLADEDDLAAVELLDTGRNNVDIDQALTILGRIWEG